MICLAMQAGPFIFPIENLNQAFGEDSFQIPHQDDVILAMEINPAGIAVFRVLALHFGSLLGVENLVQ